MPRPLLSPHVNAALDATLHGEKGPVVFDADGTLWRGDVGEDLLRYLARENIVSWAGGPVYREYERLVEMDPARAYAWGAQIMAGLEVASLEKLCADFFAERFAGRVFPWVRPLIAELVAHGFEPWVCSASPRLIVEAGAEALSIPKSRVIAVDVEVENGVLTDRVVMPVCCGVGKVTWLARRNVAPVLSLGNGDLDLDMLSTSRAAIAVAPFDAPPNALVKEALRRNWPVLRC